MQGGGPTTAERTRVLNQLQTWRERLINLDRGNPLLGINRSRTTKLRVVSPYGMSLFDTLLVDGKKLRMPFVKRRPGTPTEDESPASTWVLQEGDLKFDAAPADLYKQMRRMRDNARATVEERGVTTLHLTVGTLSWTDLQLGDSVAPLFLIPCAFESSGVDDPLVLAMTEEEPRLNPALEIYLRDRFRKQLPALPDEPVRGTARELLSQIAALFGDDWKLSDEAWLSTFSFETLVLYHDLGRLQDAAATHDITRAFAGVSVSTPPGASEQLGQHLDDAPTPDVVPIPPMAADSSQVEALAYAHLGRHVLIYGPPGTGKSQTIANLIADALACGKTVLFVSAKMAALDVVYERLRRIGIDRFCLEAHSTKAGKMRVVDELRRTLQLAEQSNGPVGRANLQQYLDLRDALNAVGREMKLVRQPVGCSIDAALELFADIHELPEVKAPLPWPDPTTVSDDVLDGAVVTLRELQSSAEVFAQRLTHPWRGCEVRDASQAMGQTLIAAIDEVRAASETIVQAAPALEPYLGALTSRSLGEIDRGASGLRGVAEADWLPRGWTSFPVEELERTVTVLDEAATHRDAVEAGLESYRSLAEGSDPLEASGMLAPALTQYRSWYKRIGGGYGAWKRQVQQRIVPRSMDFGDLRALAELTQGIAEHFGWLEQHRASWSALTPPGQALPDSSSLRDASQAFASAVQIRRGALLMGSVAGAPTKPGLPLAAQGHASEVSGEVDVLAQQAARTLLQVLPSSDRRVAEACATVHAAWPGGFAGGKELVKNRPSDLIARCDEIIAGQRRFTEWVQLQLTLDDCQKAGLEPFVEALAPFGCAKAADMFRRRFLFLWLDAHITRTPALARFQGLRQEGLIEEFRKLDAKLMESAAAAAVEGAARRAAQINQTGYAARDSQLGILRRELQRQRPRPLRKLFAEIPQVLQAIKPCMLMSPLSVSTYLTPGAIEFDVVVFDEASQIPPQEAIPSILRAKQVVVAGDDKQLPPTAFFSSSLFVEEQEDDDVEREDVEPLESLLKECQSVVPLFQPAHLRWHYRSRDERLIAFSNHHFYEGSLITFPCPDTPADRGVQLHFVEGGTWDRGKSRTNRQEARAVAQLVVQHLDTHPERSIGIVALNITQKEAIEDALEEAALARIDLKALLQREGNEPFFVKSLENVQGDERDTIIISVGYARDPSGSLYLNFGPLNQKGGERRLNVLVTRARYLTVLVTSLRSAELGGISPDNVGATRLRQFIEYAERGAKIAPPDARPTGVESNDFEDAVAQALRSRGLVVDEQVGASSFRIDLAIRDPRDLSRYLLGVECDGATYHSSRTARDRDLLRAQELRKMGWRLCRIWSIDWFRDPVGTIEATLKAVQRAMDQADPSGGVRAVTTPPADQAITLKLDRPLVATPSPASAPAPVAGPTQPLPGNGLLYKPGVPYPHATSTRPNRDLLLSKEHTSKLAVEILRIVKIEEPIHPELLLDRIKSLHGNQRITANVRANFDQGLRQVVEKRAVQRDTHGFLWTSPTNNVSAFRLATVEVTRDLDQVHPAEIRLAALHVVEAQFGIPRDALVVEVARAFGFGRASTDMKRVIEAVVDRLVAQDELKLSGFQLVLP